MKLRRPKHLGWIITGFVLVILIIFALIPKPIAVEVGTVQRQLLQQTIDAEGRIRYVDHYVINMPITGTVSAVAKEPGDSVHAGDVIAWYMPPALDARQRAQAMSGIDAALTMKNEAQEQMRAMSPMLDQAKRRAERLTRLLQEGAVPKEQAENATDAYQQLQKQMAAAEMRVRTAGYEVESARAALGATPGSRVAITSPVNGVLLRRFEEFERLLPAGSPIVEVGNDQHLEVVVDVLSTEAVRIAPGMLVKVEGWGGDSTLYAQVTKIEPAARVKVSALGVEEKRVYVIAVMEHAPRSLGDAYKADARVVTWEGKNALTVPLSALVRNGSEWMVYVVEANKVKRLPVRIGHRSALVAEVIDGITEGATVVLHPPEALKDGSAVSIQEATR